MNKKVCVICGKEIIGKYFQANINKDLKPTDSGDVVCSMECAKKYEEALPYKGKPIDHYSRITGYYQNVNGWNEGKIRELKDRRRYKI